MIQQQPSHTASCSEPTYRVVSDAADVPRIAWQQLADTSPVASWFQTPDAYDFWCSLHEVTPFVFAVLRKTDADTSEQLLGLVCGYVTRDGNPLRHFFTRRAIVQGGPLLHTDIAEAELSAMLCLMQSVLCKKAIYIEIRNFNDYSRWRDVFVHCGWKYCPHLNFHIDTSCEATVWKALSTNRKRNIRSSLQHGANIVEHPTAEQRDEFLMLLEHLYKTKIGTPLFSRDFFHRLAQYTDAHYLLVQYQERIVGGIVCVGQRGGTLYEWYVCGMEGRHKPVYPSELATYAGMSYAARNGFKRFDMMGAGKPDIPYGVRDFKARFGGTLVQHGRFLSVQHPLLYQLGTIALKFIKH